MSDIPHNPYAPIPREGEYYPSPPPPQQIQPEYQYDPSVYPSQGVPQQGYYPQQMFPQQIPPQQMFPQQMFPQQMPPQQVPPQYSAPQQLGRTPQAVNCPHCKCQTLTRVTFQSGLAAWLLCGVLSILGCWCGCCCVPFCVDECKDACHQCKNCNSLLGRRNLIA